MASSAPSSPLIVSLPTGEVKDSVQQYEAYHASGNEKSRMVNYTDMVNKYYDLSTSFYEYGWGQSFHFAHRLQGESHEQSIKRHEHYLALKLRLKSRSRVLDVGCGIGGPMREIALFSGASITGINNNAYQISRGLTLNERVGHGVAERCNFLKADFMEMPVQAGTYDAAYAIEATCHAPDSVGCFKEIFRTLKPGGMFACYEWCATDAYDPSDEQQKHIMSQIELGNGLPCVRTTTQVVQALKDAGFKVLESSDLTLTADVPWYEPINPTRLSVSSFRTTRVGRLLTRGMVSVLETLRIAPAGSMRVAAFLEQAADGLVAGGRAGIFTPMFFFLAVKPGGSSSSTHSDESSDERL